MNIRSKAFEIHTIDTDRTQLLINQEKMPGAILHQCVARTKLFTWGVLGMVFKQPGAPCSLFMMVMNSDATYRDECLCGTSKWNILRINNLIKQQ